MVQQRLSLRYSKPALGCELLAFGSQSLGPPRLCSPTRSSDVALSPAPYPETVLGSRRGDASPCPIKAPPAERHAAQQSAHRPPINGHRPPVEPIRPSDQHEPRSIRMPPRGTARDKREPIALSSNRLQPSTGPRACSIESTYTNGQAG